MKHLVKFTITTSRRNFSIPPYYFKGKRMTLPESKFPPLRLRAKGREGETVPSGFPWRNQTTHIFDLEDETDKQTIEFLKNANFCKDSELCKEQGGTYWYQFIDPQEQAAKKIDNSMKIASAMAAVMEIVKWSGSENKDIAVQNWDKFRLLGYICLGKDVADTNKKEPLGAILQHVQENPGKVLSVLQDGKGKFEKLIVDALKLGVMKKQGFNLVFGEERLGNQKTVLHKISGSSKDSKTLYNALREEVKLKMQQ